MRWSLWQYLSDAAHAGDEIIGRSVRPHIVSRVSPSGRIEQLLCPLQQLVEPSLDIGVALHGFADDGAAFQKSQHRARLLSAFRQNRRATDLAEHILEGWQITGERARHMGSARVASLEVPGRHNPTRLHGGRLDA